MNKSKTITILVGISCSGKSMDVGVDTNNLYPYHLDEILTIMKGKETVIIDHHNQHTT